MESSQKGEKVKLWINVSWERSLEFPLWVLLITVRNSVRWKGLFHWHLWLLFPPVWRLLSSLLQGDVSHLLNASVPLESIILADAFNICTPLLWVQPHITRWQSDAFLQKLCKYLKVHISESKSQYVLNLYIYIYLSVICHISFLSFPIVNT